MVEDFLADAPESIERDIRTIQRELPIDILEFFVLTPLPGSADHEAPYQTAVPVDPDMNRYDVEHVTTAHPRMTTQEWQGIYDRAWHLYYSRGKPRRSDTSSTLPGSPSTSTCSWTR